MAGALVWLVGSTTAPAHAATPKAGRLCKLSEVGRVDGDLLCTRVNTRAVWRRTGVTTTTATSSRSPERDGADLLAEAPVENEHKGGYKRALFPLWLDLDGDGCNTRENALRRESTTPVQLDQAGCKVIAGTWVSPYDATAWTDPTKVDIDHVVSLKEAWDSGGWEWTPERRAAYANDLSDPRTLRVTTASVQRAKGDRDPSNWLPPLPSAVCGYLGDWVAIKARWGLSMDQSERGRIRNLFRDRCPGLRIAGWAPIVLPTMRPGPAPSSTVGGRSAAATTAPSPTTGVYYANCAAAKAAGVAPLHRGDPGYRTALDGDGDGNACTS